MNEMAWNRLRVRDLITHHASGPSPTCEERPIAEANEWGLLKTTAITWNGWNATAHKVPPQLFWFNHSIEVKPGDVLVTKAGPRERCCVVVYVLDTPPRLMVSGKMILLRPDLSKVNTVVLACLLAREDVQRYIDSRTTGMADAQLNFTNELLLDTFVDVPPQHEQSKIARILTTLDHLIEKTESLIAKYQAIKQGMMHDLFTRGVDAHGHLRPTQAEAPDLYKQSELGWIPKEWEVGRLVNRITFPQGQVDPRRLPYRDWILVAPDHIEQRTGRLLGRQTAADQGAISGKYEFLAGDVVYSKIRPYLRKAILASEHGICSADMYPLRPLPALRSQCLLGIVLGEHFSRFAESVSARSGFPKINRSELAEYHASFPELNEQDRICRIIESHERQAEREQALLAKYKQQKTGLMQDLLTGKVRVKVDEAEEVAP